MKFVTIASMNHLIVASLHHRLEKLGYKTFILADRSRFLPLFKSASLRQIVCLDVTVPLSVLLELIQLFHDKKTLPQGVAVILILPDGTTLPEIVGDSLQRLALPLFRFPQETEELLSRIEDLSGHYHDDADA